MFCIRCGRPAKVDNFCAECFLIGKELFQAKDFRMVYCGICGMKESEIHSAVSRSMKTSYVITSEKISMRLVGNRAYVTIEAEGRIKSLPKSETKKIIVTLKKRMCDMHAKLSGGYYEAMIQARGSQKDTILRKVKRLLPEKSIVDIEILKEGYNVKVMRKSNAAAAAKALGENFSVKSSYKVGGSKKGQMVYRNYYAVR